MERKIILIGHHVSNLGERYNGLYALGKEMVSAPSQIEKIDRHAVRGVKSFLPMEFYKGIIEDEGLEIAIADGRYDTLCFGDENHLPCLNMGDIRRCGRKYDNQDLECLDEYELKPGDTIMSRDLIKIVESYKARTGFSSPREKFGHEQFGPNEEPDGLRDGHGNALSKEMFR